ncbi:hypothetical protein AM571_CH01751 [Rhizobium etli 8C-3]|uniref:Uncharacterized protein n=1 Tax=Rhizobium etli 8C-3 TaxID=538025 RepID=A0A1L5P328_RHIET|nr:hypothetical protein [Rhizobium etli]APO74572.1 hypothetical protein AM571_CH01751 [Rhizobium etli 8C-3]
MADVSADLEAARQRYNDLYPDRPIKRVGDTLEAVFYLYGIRCAWENGRPLTEKEIAAVERITPPGCFS